MSLNYQRYRDLILSMENLPEKDVTEEEFIDMMIKAGRSKDYAVFNAEVTKKMGSRIYMSGEMVGIKES